MCIRGSAWRDDKAFWRTDLHRKRLSQRHYKSIFHLDGNAYIPSLFLFYFGPPCNTKYFSIFRLYRLYLLHAFVYSRYASEKDISRLVNISKLMNVYWVACRRHCRNESSKVTNESLHKGWRRKSLLPNILITRWTDTKSGRDY